MRALDIDRRIIFIFVFIGVAVPLLVEFSIPIKPTPPVISAYDAFEKVAAEKPGSTILLSFSYGASTAPEMQPMARAVLRHCFRLGFKVVGICLWPDGVGLAEAVLKQVSEELGKKEDIDYAFLGYKPGTTAVILNMGQDLHTAFPVDSKGVSLADVPVTKDIHPLTDFSFVFDLAAEEGNQGQRQDDQRKCHEHIHHPLEQEVDIAAEIGAGDTQDQPGEGADERAREADEQRRAGAVDDA